MPNRYDRDADERNRGEFSSGPTPRRHDFGGYYARDDHRGGFDDAYGRDRGFSGGGRADQYTRESQWGGSGFGGGYGSYDRDRSGAETTGGQPSFRGRGPKNWRPTDERIRDTINELLTDHDGIDATEIEVAVENSEVTLTGTVGSRWEKRVADDIAHSARGVRDVHNRLRIADREAQTGKASE